MPMEVKVDRTLFSYNGAEVDYVESFLGVLNTFR